jgi:hypothetical protein
MQSYRDSAEKEIMDVCQEGLRDCKTSWTHSALSPTGGTAEIQIPKYADKVNSWEVMETITAQIKK